MSWGYEKTGTKEAIIESMARYLDEVAKSYAGKPEADDVAACKERIEALVSACDFSDGLANAVMVKANGSHSTGPKGIYSASFTVQVQRVSLAL